MPARHRYRVRVRRIVSGAVVVLVPLLFAGLVAWRPGPLSGGRLFDQVMRLTAKLYVDSLSVDSAYLYAARGLIRELHDPYSTLMTPTQAQQFANELDGDYAGTGLSMRLDEGTLVVERVLPETPAANAGILVGDRILQIDRLTPLNFPDWNPTGLIGKITGPPGTSVQLTLQRAGVAHPLHVTVQRATLHIPVVPYAMVLDDHVGYVPFTMFTATAAHDVQAAIDSVRQHGASGVVLDLRGNPGGLRDQAVAVANLFLPNNQVVLRVQHRDDPMQALTTHRAPTEPDLPLVVLVNGQTASAAEVLSGALQDYKRAVLVGAQTFGKGVVQRLFPLEGNYGLKLTVQRWYTPSGRSIHKGSDGRGGLTPDLVVDATAGTVGERTLVNQLHPRSVLFRSLLNGYAAEFRGKVGPQFTVTSSIRQGFIRRLERNGIPLDSSIVVQNAPYLDRMLGMQITRLAISDSAAKQKYLHADPQLAEAVVLLDNASTQQDVWTALENERKTF
jgi:carboxyl-terminal processing protease